MSTIHTKKENPISDIVTIPSNNDSPDVTTLSPTQLRMVNLYLTGSYSLAKIAQLLEVHPNTVQNWMKNKEVQRVIEETQQFTHNAVATRMKALTLKAAEKMEKLIDSPIDGVALQAVKDVLDRAGHKPKQEIKVDKTVTYEEKIKNLINQTIVDAEYDVVEDE